MNKNDLLKCIAEKGYDVGFGAKKHFATYDIIEKAPGLISFIAMAFGILSLAVDGLSTELTSAIFIIFGVVGLYISLYDDKKHDYSGSGSKLTQLCNELKLLYLKVKNSDESEDFRGVQQSLSEIENRHYSMCISKQILFSNWYAHYKFFWEHQIAWIDEQLKFGFWRDKIPLSLVFFLLILLAAAAAWFFDLLAYVCK